MESITQQSIIPKRGAFQGVWNIIRFNWHFYVVYLVALVVLAILAFVLSGFWPWVMLALMAAATLSTGLSLWASYYVYDASKLYELNWLETPQKVANIININAGFDETSVLLAAKFPESDLQVMDFYNPEKHTEVSIKRARKAYPPYAGTVRVATNRLTLPDKQADLIMNILAAHEIREEQERIAFFKELKRVLKPNGEIVVVEHLRDWANFLVYNLGFFHFQSKATWLRTFKAAGLQVKTTHKHTPFLTIFTLSHGNAS